MDRFPSIQTPETEHFWSRFLPGPDQTDLTSLRPSDPYDTPNQRRLGQRSLAYASYRDLARRLDTLEHNMAATSLRLRRVIEETDALPLEAGPRPDRNREDYVHNWLRVQDREPSTRQYSFPSTVAEQDQAQRGTASDRRSFQSRLRRRFEEQEYASIDRQLTASRLLRESLGDRQTSDDSDQGEERLFSRRRRMPPGLSSPRELQAHAPPRRPLALDDSDCEERLLSFRRRLPPGPPSSRNPPARTLTRNPRVSDSSQQEATGMSTSLSRPRDLHRPLTSGLQPRRVPTRHPFLRDDSDSEERPTSVQMPLPHPVPLPPSQQASSRIDHLMNTYAGLAGPTQDDVSYSDRWRVSRSLRPSPTIERESRPNAQVMGGDEELGRGEMFYTPRPTAYRDRDRFSEIRRSAARRCERIRSRLSEVERLVDANFSLINWNQAEPPTDHPSIDRSPTNTGLLLPAAINATGGEDEETATQDAGPLIDVTPGPASPTHGER